MTKLEEAAFDWADAECRCEQDSDAECIAGALMRGYVAGFRRAKLELLNLEPGRAWIEQPIRVVKLFWENTPDDDKT